MLPPTWMQDVGVPSGWISDINRPSDLVRTAPRLLLPCTAEVLLSAASGELLPPPSAPPDEPVRGQKGNEGNGGGAAGRDPAAALGAHHAVLQAPSFGLQTGDVLLEPSHLLPTLLLHTLPLCSPLAKLHPSGQKEQVDNQLERIPRFQHSTEEKKKHARRWNVVRTERRPEERRRLFLDAPGLQGLTHQLVHVLLVVCGLLLQGVLGVQQLLLQITDLAQRTSPSRLERHSRRKRSVYLSVRPLPVGLGRVLLVPQQRLQLRDGAAQSGHLRSSRRQGPEQNTISTAVRGPRNNLLV